MTPPDRFLPPPTHLPGAGTTEPLPLPRTAGPVPIWERGTEALAVRFVGLSGDHDRRRVLDLVAAPHVGLAHLRQVHSARVIEARAGACGEADGLVATDPLLALCVVTADCVPVLLGGGDRIGAVHAGWRGIVDGVVTAATDKMGLMSTGGPSTLTAWIGPAIGPCCYEVSPEVAAAVAEASAKEVLISRPGARPHLDLQLAVQRQLEARGILSIETIRTCTRCHPQWLHSYRREGPDAGRNHAFIWRQESFRNRHQVGRSPATTC